MLGIVDFVICHRENPLCHIYISVVGVVLCDDKYRSPALLSNTGAGGADKA